MAKAEASTADNAVHSLAQFSDDLQRVVGEAARSVVCIDDGSRLPASGTIWTADGVVVATSHGIERDEELTVILPDGTRHAATLVGRDPDTDIAVLRIEGANSLSVLPRAAAETVGVGQFAIALGQPGNSGLLATFGIVSARRDTQTEGHDEYILSTDADLYPGVSGGPLVNARGEMVGLLDRLYGRGLGVALGTPLVARVVETLLTHGRMPRAHLGIRTQLVAIPTALRGSLGLTQENGLLVVGVAESSPAEQGGLLLGDTLLSVGGEAVEDVDTLRRHLRAGQAVSIEALRGGQRVTLTPTVGAAAD